MHDLMFCSLSLFRSLPHSGIVAMALRPCRFQVVPSLVMARVLPLVLPELREAPKFHCDLHDEFTFEEN
jgi:hypothetical protein